MAYALRHAEGKQGFLFRRWTNVRRDLNEACERAGIAPCSPNDLRRTCATWLRRTEPNHLETVPRAGIEPATRGFSVPVTEWPEPRKR
jgi:integrase